MSSKPFVSAIGDYLLDISGQLNIKPTPGTTDNSGIRFFVWTIYPSSTKSSEEKDVDYEIIEGGNE